MAFHSRRASACAASLVALACGGLGRPALAAPASPVVPPPPMIVSPAPPVVAPQPVVTAPIIPTPDQEKALIADALKGKGDYFVDCDGYAAASSKADGMTRWTARFFGLSASLPGTQRGVPEFNEPWGIAACGAALSDLHALPQYWMRKVNLLRARALHRLAINDVTGALRDLDDAESTVPKAADIYYQRTLGLGLSLVRAYALQRSGEVDKALALALRAVDERPYSREVAQAAVLAIDNVADTSPLLERWARIDPIGADLQFDHAFDTDRFDEVIRLFPGVSPIPKLGNLPMQYREAAWLAQENRALADMFWVRAYGRYAYALAATGHISEARDAIAAVREKIDDDLPKGASPAVSEDASAQEKTDAAVSAQGDLMVKTKVVPIVDAWATLVEARCTLTRSNAEEHWTSITMPGAKFARDWALIDLASAIAVDAPEHADYARALVRKYKENSVLPPNKVIPDLFKALPQSEIAGDSNAFKGNIYGIHGKTAGFTVKESASGVTTLSFLGINDSYSLVEERALLEAAKLGRDSGRNGVIVLGRRNITHTLTRTYYGRPINTSISGYETQVDVALVDPASPPPIYVKEPWRIIGAEALITNLEPIYQPAEAQP